jgi:hypothetical protein
VQWFLSTLDRCHTDLLQSGWFSLINTIIFNISLLQLSTRKSKQTLFFRLSLCLFLVWSLGCLELFPNSHLRVFGHQATGPAFHLTITKPCNLSEFEPDDLTRVVLRLLTYRDKEQPPLLDRIEDHLILVDSIKMIPLGLCNMSCERIVSHLSSQFLFINWF